MGDVRRLEPDEVVLVGAGLLGFLASFLPWVDVVSISASAWSEGFFPTFTWVGIAGLACALLTLLPAFTAVKVPTSFAGFTMRQCKLILADLALLLTLSFLVAGEEHAAGFWLSLVASIGLVVGAAILSSEETPPGELA